MSLSIQNLTVIIVSYMSDHIIHDCIKSLPNDLKILVVENSNNKIFKESIEKKYKNIECILSKQNLGMGVANNLGLRNIKTDYALILNPDVILENNSLTKLIKASEEIDNFGILSPVSKDKNLPNYKIKKNNFNYDNFNSPFKVESVDGFAMLLNVKKINSLENFKNFNFFDENIFLYLENDDFCKRLIDNNENIYIVPDSKINHIGAGSVDKKYSFQIEISRNWHWIWSKFYFNKKHKGFIFAFLSGFPSFSSALFKSLIYFFIGNKNKSKIYKYRYLGFINAVMGNKSYLRPKIDV